MSRYFVKGSRKCRQKSMRWCKIRMAQNMCSLGIKTRHGIDIQIAPGLVHGR
jgi:hypothetical protein